MKHRIRIEADRRGLATAPAAASGAREEKGDWLRSAAQVPVPVFLLHQSSAASGAREGRKEAAGGASPR